MTFNVLKCVCVYYRQWLDIYKYHERTLEAHTHCHVRWLYIDTHLMCDIRLEYTTLMKVSSRSYWLASQWFTSDNQLLSLHWWLHFGLLVDFVGWLVGWLAFYIYTHTHLSTMSWIKPINALWCRWLYN